MRGNSNNKIFFKRSGQSKFLFDLRFYVNHRLKKLNIHNLDNIEMDTYEDKKNFFSFRRSVHLGEKDYGRCISTICLKT
jgi:copper oxidase (laccase) domain-containing protein